MSSLAEHSKKTSLIQTTRDVVNSFSGPYLALLRYLERNGEIEVREAGND